MKTSFTCMQFLFHYYSVALVSTGSQDPHCDMIRFLMLLGACQRVDPLSDRVTVEKLADW